jgi:hypothetical protein
MGIKNRRVGSLADAGLEKKVRTRAKSFASWPELMVGSGQEEQVRTNMSKWPGLAAQVTNASPGRDLDV